jgi:PhnB protein
MADPHASDIAAGSLTPYIAVRNAAEAIRFYIEAFGAVELFRLVDPSNGRIGHAELRVGSGLLMLSDESEQFGARSPETLGGSPVRLHLDVPDAAAAFARALRRGATEVRKLELQFYGYRQGLVADPFGYTWFIGEKVEDVSPAEMQKRWSDMAKA